MKKALCSIVVLVFLMSCVTPSYAALRKDMTMVKGKLVSMNPATGEVTVKDSTTGKDVTLTSKSGVDASIKIGSDVKVLYNKNTRVANWVRIDNKY